MTRNAEGKLDKITIRDVAKNPALLLLLFLGLGGTGTGVLSTVSIATKSDIYAVSTAVQVDVRRIESKLDDVANDVAELKIESRAREISEARNKLSQSENKR